MKKLSAFLTALTLLAGCYTLERAHSTEKGRDQLFVSNYGWYLFHCIPLACGDAEPNNSGFTLFRDDVTMDRLQTNFFRYCDKNAVKPTRVVYHIQDDILFNIPGLDIPIPIPYIITYREIQLSGVLNQVVEKESK